MIFGLQMSIVMVVSGFSIFVKRFAGGEVKLDKIPAFGQLIAFVAYTKVDWHVHHSFEVERSNEIDTLLQNWSTSAEREGCMCGSGSRNNAFFLPKKHSRSRLFGNVYSNPVRNVTKSCRS